MKQVNLGIWKYSSLLPKLAGTYRLTLGEGSTALIKKQGIYFKCEFNNPTGSVKDRGVCYQLAKVKESGKSYAVISSSGNAAISASYYCKLHQIKLTACVSRNLNPSKLAAIDRNTEVLKSNRPLSHAIRISRERRIPNLRPSKDPFGSVGYRTLSLELYEDLPQVDAVFIPMSSGATLRGIFEGFLRIPHRTPAIHAVQTTLVNPLARRFDSDFRLEKKSLADAIVAKFTPLEDEIAGIIKKTKGFAWVISNKEMRACQQKLKKLNLICSYEGAAALAALIKARKRGFNYQNPVVVLSGKKY